MPVMITFWCSYTQRQVASWRITALSRSAAKAVLREEFVPPLLARDDGPLVTGALGKARFSDTPDGFHYVRVSPQVTVRAIDPGARVRLTKLSGGRDRRVGPIGIPMTITAGLWRVEALMGEDVIAVREEDFADSHTYEVSATAEITPAPAALMLELEAIARKRAGAITKSAASLPAKGLKAWQLRRSPIALGAIEIRRYCMIVYTDPTPAPDVRHSRSRIRPSQGFPGHRRTDRTTP